jgi:pantetheine-phosphate adenylyltransferase
MKVENKAVYPGTFDPITNGHLDIIERTASLFNKVYILVAINPGKTPLFTLDERIEMIRCATRHLANVETVTYDGLLVDFAKEKGVKIIVRGLRAISDFEYELQMAMMNKKLNPDVDTLFMAPNENFTYLNSTIVKQVASFGGDISKFVPPCVRKYFRGKFPKSK